VAKPCMATYATWITTIYHSCKYTCFNACKMSCNLGSLGTILQKHGLMIGKFSYGQIT